MQKCLKKLLAGVCHCVSQLFYNSVICGSVKHGGFHEHWCTVCLTLFHGIKSIILFLARLFAYSVEF